MYKKIIISLFLIFGVNSKSVFAVSVEDSLALVDLYDSTDGDNWTNHTNWKTDSVSTWYGVTVDTGRVISLSLNINNLSGTIPSSIGNLSSLRTLNFSINQITGSIPPEIGNLSNLECLFLASNQITGSIPPEIGNLSNLEHLYLTDNQITGSIPPEIGNLDSLERLLLNINQLTGSIPPEIGDLSNLEHLFLSINQIKGSVPTEIVNLSNLLVLYLENNQLTGTIPSEIGNLSNLRDLYLYDNELTDLPDLSSSTSLQRLRVQNNKFTFEDIEPNIDIPDSLFTYSPQDSVGKSKDTTIVENLNFTMSVSVGGENNLYQWKKDAVAISGATDSSYTIISAEPGDAGSYICEITNTVATELTLYSKPINVTVIPPYITVTTPNGGEDWRADSTYDITWISVGTTGNVRIEYSTNNGFSWIQAAGSTVDDGSYSWRIPDMSSDSCLVRVKNWSGSPSDISNSVFSILSSSAALPAKLPEVYSLEVKGITADKTLELRYAFPEKAEFKLEVYDIKGTKVKELSGKSPAGFYSRRIDMNGKSAGVYFLRIEANGKKFTQINKVLLVK